ncbi:MAG: hypothetical protein FWD12_04295 [Alphaproteobacteria bacterium]|nr:hypothetical protein [Alphaproteobacteria bacterium]
MRSRWIVGLCAALAAAGSAQAETGVTDQEITIGQTIAYKCERFDGQSFVLFGEPVSGVPNPQ